MFPPSERRLYLLHLSFKFFILIFLFFSWPLAVPPAHAEWDFTLADESRITLNVQNLDHREDFKLDFLPPISGKPLTISEIDAQGKKAISFTLRGYADKEVDRILVNGAPVVTSQGFFLYPVTLIGETATSLEFVVNTSDGKTLKYRVNMQFIPPESIHTRHHLTYIDILQTIFNFQLSLSTVNLNSGAFSKTSSVTIFPVLGGRLTIEPQFFKYVYARGLVYSSIFKDPSANTTDVAFSIFTAYLSGRYPIHAGGDFWLTPEVGIVGRAHSIIQNTTNFRIGVTSYGAYGIRGAFVITPNRLWSIEPQFSYFFTTTSASGEKIKHTEVGFTLGYRVADLYFLGMEYNINLFSLSQTTTGDFSETYHQFLVHMGTYL